MMWITGAPERVRPGCQVFRLISRCSHPVGRVECVSAGPLVDERACQGRGTKWSACERSEALTERRSVLPRLQAVLRASQRPENLPSGERPPLSRWDVLKSALAAAEAPNGESLYAKVSEVVAQQVQP